MELNKAKNQNIISIKGGVLLRGIFVMLMLFAMASLSSCFDNEGLDFEVDNELIKKKLSERIDDYYKTRKTTCLVSILDDAENYVDTFIVNLINHDILDGIVFPEKPIKPPYPLRIILDDSTQVLPIFMKEE
jgi:hypothetical protein